MRARGAVPALVALLCAACAAPRFVDSQVAAGGYGARVGKVAVAPFVPDERHAADVEPDGPALVRSRVFEALDDLTGWEVVPPGEVERWLAREEVAVGDAEPSEVGDELRRAFGADAVLYGSVRRYLSREGGPRGAQRPASVWFELELRLPGGERLWHGSYRERQAAVSDNLLALPRAIGRGFRWVDASGLAREGALELVEDLAREQRTWR